MLDYWTNSIRVEMRHQIQLLSQFNLYTLPMTKEKKRKESNNSEGTITWDYLHNRNKKEKKEKIR